MKQDQFTGLAVLFPTTVATLYWRGTRPRACLISILVGEALLVGFATGGIPAGFALGFLPVTYWLMDGAQDAGIAGLFGSVGAEWLDYYWCALIGIGVTLLLVAISRTSTLHSCWEPSGRTRPSSSTRARSS